MDKPEALRLADELAAWEFSSTGLCGKSAAELRRLAAVEAELERERMRLAACAVVALADTPGSAKHARQMHPDYESASCQDVARRVDECISLRAQRDALLEALELLVSYTESCEGLLNASPAGQVLKARAAIKAVEETK